MATNPQDFFIEHNGKFLDVDGAFGPECVDVIKAFFSECLGIAPVKGNAIDYWTTPPQGFTKETEPKYWDLVVFDYKPVGHIAVLNWSSATEINCFSQNDPLGAPCGFKTYPRDSHILGYLRWPNFPAPAPRPEQTPKVRATFTMQYTAVNADPNLLEQARQILLKDSAGRIDCSFVYSYIPEITAPMLWTFEDQQAFLKLHPISTPFCFLTYSPNDPGHYDATTHTVSGSQVYLTAAQGPIPAMSVAFEMLHGLTYYILDKGFPIGLPLDNFNATPELVQTKVNTILPYLDKLLATK